MLKEIERNLNNATHIYLTTQNFNMIHVEIEKPKKKDGWVLLLPAIWVNWDEFEFAFNIGWLCFSLEFSIDRR